MLNYSIAREDDVCIVFISGQLNAENAAELTEVLLGLDELKIVIDMNGLHYITSDGLKPLLAWLEKTRPFASRRGLTLCGLQPFVQNIFRICGLDTKFRTFAELEEALRAS